jgi:type II secretory pathway component GspD/PulD (secretin)
VKTPFFALLPLLAATAFAAEPGALNIIIEVQMVAVPRATALPLIPDLRNPEKIEAAVAKIQELLASGTAQLVAWPVVTTRPGQRAIAENIQEIRYATEFEPASTEIQLTDKEGAITKQPNEVRGIDQPVTPTSFETRNAGATLEVEPSINPTDGAIELNLVAQHVRLRGMRKIVIESGAIKTTLDQPDFSTNKTQTTVTLKNGQRLLLGVFQTDEPADHLELFLLKAEYREP